MVMKFATPRYQPCTRLPGSTSVTTAIALAALISVVGCSRQHARDSARAESATGTSTRGAIEIRALDTSATLADAAPVAQFKVTTVLTNRSRSTVWMALCGGTRSGLSELHRRDSSGSWTLAYRPACLLGAGQAPVAIAPGDVRFDTAIVVTTLLSSSRIGPTIGTRDAPGSYRAVFEVRSRADLDTGYTAEARALLPRQQRTSTAFVVRP